MAPYPMAPWLGLHNQCWVAVNGQHFGWFYMSTHSEDTLQKQRTLSTAVQQHLCNRKMVTLDLLLDVSSNASR